MEDQSFFRRVRQIELVAAKLVDQLLGGRYRSIFRGQGIEFDEVREYVAGDDVRAIDWNVTSRMALPHTKIFREEREIILFNVVDISASLYAGSGEIGKNEYAAHVFAILSLAAVKNNDRVGAAFFSDRIEKWIPPSKGRKHILSLIHELLKMQPGGLLAELLPREKLADQRLVPVRTETLNFQLADGGISYEKFRVNVAEDLPLNFRGRVGFDDSVKMWVSVPLSTPLLERILSKSDRQMPPLLAANLEKITLELPIVGTRRKPVLDVSAVDVPKLLEQVMQGAVQKPLETIFDILKPQQKQPSSSPR